MAVWLLTALSGRGPGCLTLGVSVFAVYWVLIPPMFALSIPVARNVVELIVLTIVGAIMIFAQDSYHRSQLRHMALLEREALINRIGVAIRSTLNPQQVPEVAARALGEALGVDRCYFSLYDLSRDTAHVGTDWCGPELPSLAGDYRISDFSVKPEDQYPGEAVQVVRDVKKANLPPAVLSALETLRLRSGISAPIFSKGRLVAALAVAMSDVAREWTPDEVAIVTAIASMTRSALELAQVHQREIKIAEILQNALQPVVPVDIPGLDLAPYYKACLDEASVGGDFSDVFAIDKGTFSLVVGDVSGKGLAAASQVATIRNMLRYSLYTETDLAAGITRLNSVLASNGLVSGFATLAVAVFDTGAKAMRYVSCGQEPLLLRRTAEGAIEQLGPTGPILGFNEGVTYTAHDVPLSPGDAFLLYTDGLTESGPNRRELLGVEGMIALLKSGSARSAHHLMQDIVSGAQAHAGGAFADDVCMLVGIVT